jgi:mono/diheme cytochrome c family protein
MPLFRPFVALTAALLSACGHAGQKLPNSNSVVAVPAVRQTQVARGLSFVEANCSGCHSLRPGIEPPNPQAPSFVAIANDLGFNEESLREFFRDGHDTPAAMSIRLDGDEAETAAAYIMSLRSPPAALSQAEAGHGLVQARCASCHAVEMTGVSPRSEAPPLRDLYKRYPVDGLRSALLAGVHVGHRDMPTFRMPTSEVEAVLAYLKSVDPCAQPSSDRTAMDRCFAPL